METSKQNVAHCGETGKITRKVAGKILERLNTTGQLAPSGKPYTPDMIRNWLYGKSRDPKIETVYMLVVAESNYSPHAEEKKKAAMMHLEMAERLLSEI